MEITDERIEQITEQFFNASKADRPSDEGQPLSPKPVDVYQRDRKRMRDVGAKSFPKGSSAIVNTAVTAVIDGMGGEGLTRAYRRARDDSESLKDRGEIGRAGLRRKQYMEEYFLPAVEIVVNSTTPDEVLANERALKELDKYALLEGPGDGYTATYIRQAYGNQLGQVQSRSDDTVRSTIRRLNVLLDDGQVRTAFGLASKLKEQIDKGEHQADSVDYDLLGRIIAYGG